MVIDTLLTQITDTDTGSLLQTLFTDTFLVVMEFTSFGV